MWHLCVDIPIGGTYYYELHFTKSDSTVTELVSTGNEYTVLYITMHRNWPPMIWFLFQRHRHGLGGPFSNDNNGYQFYLHPPPPGVADRTDSVHLQGCHHHGSIVLPRMVDLVQIVQLGIWQAWRRGFCGRRSSADDPLWCGQKSISCTVVQSCPCTATVYGAVFVYCTYNGTSPPIVRRFGRGTHQDGTTDHASIIRRHLSVHPAAARGERTCRSK